MNDAAGKASLGGSEAWKQQQHPNDAGGKSSVSASEVWKQPQLNNYSTNFV